MQVTFYLFTIKLVILREKKAEYYYMKHSGCTFEYEEERNNDFMRAYTEQIAGRREIILADVFSRVVEMPSKRFWVSEERAAIVISDMMRGKSLDKMRQKKREMFQEIYRRTMSILEKQPGMSVYDAVSVVVRSPAPQFYLTPQSARIIFYRIKKKWYERNLAKLSRSRHHHR